MLSYLTGFSNSSRIRFVSFISGLYLVGLSIIVKNEFASVCEIPLGVIPFRYLGVPLSSKRLTAVECEHLALKMTSKIRSWQVRNLSYATRLQLGSALLMNITNFWCQLFVLPKKVFQQVNAICRAFLWHV